MSYLFKQLTMIYIELFLRRQFLTAICPVSSTWRTTSRPLKPGYCFIPIPKPIPTHFNPNPIKNELDRNTYPL